MIRQMDILMSDESNKPAPTGWIIAIDKKLDAFKLDADKCIITDAIHQALDIQSIISLMQRNDIDSKLVDDYKYQLEDTILAYEQCRCER